jgi:hypothetical protein
MKMIRVKSRNIYAVGHDGTTLRMTFADKNGDPTVTWNYHDVPGHVHKELMGSESIGSYFARLIKPNYRGTKHEQ